MANQKKTPSKLCLKCNRVLPLGDFYPNKKWSAQSYRDTWCKECAKKNCKTQEQIKQYCYENNRVWKDSFWDSAMKKAQYILSTSAEYIDPKTTSTKRRELEERTAASQFFSLMNMANVYGYIENVTHDGTYISPAMREQEKRQSEELVYNHTWRGSFTAAQIEALEEIYEQYEEDFVLDNVSMRDYARKVAKASLNADIAEDRMRRGEISASDYKEAQRIFDDLSKSSNFAACKRKPGEASGMGSLGDIILKLEVNGDLDFNGFTFPEDDVDKIIADFRHTLTAVSAEGQL